MEYSNEFMDIVECQFMSYLQRVANGMRKNYFKKLASEAAKVSFFCDLTTERCDNLKALDDEYFAQDNIFKNEALFHALGILTERQKNIVLGIFIDGMTETEMAVMLKTTQPYINVTKKKLF